MTQKFDMTHINSLYQEASVSCSGAAAAQSPVFLPSPCQAPLPVQSPKIEEEKDTLHLEEEHQHGAVQAAEAGSSFAQKVTQAQPAVWVQEKEAVSLHCTYDTSAGNYDLLWYKQPSSGEMVFLILQNSYSQKNATKGRYSLILQKASKSIQLVIPASQLGDSAVYFCALRDDTVGEL
ncbi:T-cell receptor alpha chain V region HPB-MLT [Sciurus carolinensis]|nr:T-cell receptor alpha chain V region HPB-MLT [Sciurus carolinensis]